MKATLKVTGLSLINPDGQNRQNILHAVGTGWHTARLKPATCDGERIVNVYIAGYLVGTVSKRQLGNPLASARELTALVEFNPGANLTSAGAWHVTLSERQTPSSSEYAYMKKLCTIANRTMPAYDKRAYACYWSVVNA